MPVDHNCPEVVVQGLCRKRSDHWCITLFLVNEQQEPLRLKDTAWVFQPKLMAEGVDGAAVIHKRHTILELSGTDPAVKAENDLLAMLYRRHVEFAVGHGIGVHVDVSPDPNHAVRVRTKVVPSYEIPRTTPPRPEDAEINPAFAKLEGLVLDMKVLADANPKQYRSMLKPLVNVVPDSFQVNQFDSSTLIGIPVAPFPRWMVCPFCRRLAPLGSGLFKLETAYRPDQIRYVHANCTKPGKPPTVLPARFIVACKNGHFDDFPWREFVHRGTTKCKGGLKLFELSATGEASGIEGGSRQQQRVRAAVT